MSDKKVHVYPLPGAFIPGVPHVEQDVTPREAAGLLAYFPPAFTTEPPQKQAEPDKPKQEN